MTTHLREQILTAIKTAVTGLTTTGERVYRSRVAPLARTEVPALIVVMGNEARLKSTLGAPRQHTRSMTVEVKAVVHEVADYETQLNLIAKEVEVVLAMPTTSITGIHMITLDGIGKPEAAQGEGGALAALTMTYEIEYATLENAPSVAQ